MSITYQINEHGQVVPYISGRKNNDTLAWRDATELELNMKDEIQDLIKENVKLQLELDFRAELYKALAARFDRNTAKLAQMTVNRDGLDDALNELWHYHSLTSAAYEFIETARAKYGKGPE